MPSHPLLVQCVQDYRTPIYPAVRENHIDIARYLLDHGANLHARDEDICSTPLGWATRRGHQETADLLREAEATRSMT